jgi:hypothetical protein
MQEAIFPAPLVDSLMRIMLLFRIGLARHCPTEADLRPGRIVVWRWLCRVERRLLSLIAPFQAGTLPPLRPDAPHTPPTPRPSVSP